MEELWKDIEDFKEYQISNKGKVYSKKNLIYLKPEKDWKGYLRVTLWKDGKRKRLKIARLVAIHFIPNPENKPQVNHMDGIKLNNFDWNLEWATDSENKYHAHKLGLYSNS